MYEVGLMHPSTNSLNEVCYNYKKKIKLSLLGQEKEQNKLFNFQTTFVFPRI